MFSTTEDQDAGTPGIASDIREVNLAYLLLAQRLVREDRATAMIRLGLTRGVKFSFDFGQPLFQLFVFLSGTTEVPDLLEESGGCAAGF